VHECASVLTRDRWFLPYWVALTCFPYQPLALPLAKRIVATGVRAARGAR
jgi:hypothetical protein